MSRAEIAQTLDVSPSTVTKAVKPLIDDGYLEELTGERSRARSQAPVLGRPSQRLQVNKARHAAVGIKVRPDRLIGVLTDLRTEIRDYRTVSLTDRSPGTVLGAVEELALELADGGGTADDHVLGLGVSISGHVDAAQKTCRYSALLGWHDVEIADRLHARTGLRTVVSNDVNALTVGERWFGEGRDYQTFVVITMGTGIGCGLFLNGRLFTGGFGMAGEIGHVPVQPDGPRCNCGRHGCLEAVASYDAVLRGITERGGPVCADIDMAIDLARSDDGPAGAAAVAAFSDAGDALGRALASLCNLFNPQKLILAGEGVKARGLFGPSMEAALRAHTFSSAADDCDLTSILIDDADWARGAACLVVHTELGSLA
ncbi:ROK family protein [Spirillospora sp. NBC_00431]